MPKQVKLEKAEVLEKLKSHGGWSLDDKGQAITKTFGFDSFAEAFAFMTQCALAAEKLYHHPDWSNSYSTVKVTLSTHSSGGLTELDFMLALKMDEAESHFRI